MVSKKRHTGLCLVNTERGDWIGILFEACAHDNITKSRDKSRSLGVPHMYGLMDGELLVEQSVIIAAIELM